MKNMIKNGVPEENLTIIEFSDSDFAFIAKLIWVNDNEFHVDGHLYDIIRTESANGNTRYYCINDKQEEQLFAGLDRLSKEAGNSSRNANQKQTNLLSKLIHDAVLQISSQKQVLINTNCIFFYLGLEPFIQMADIPTPPPERQYS